MLVGLVVVLAACSTRHDDRKTVVAASPALASATQADLAREIDQADRHATWTEVRRRWQGQQLHWTVTRQRSLCRTAEACHVAPFPVQRPAQQGWMPALSFAPGEFAKLDRACGRAEQCELVIDATLAELDVSPELPTHMKLSDVKVVRAAPARG